MEIGRDSDVRITSGEKSGRGSRGSERGTSVTISVMRECRGLEQSNLLERMKLEDKDERADEIVDGECKRVVVVLIYGCFFLPCEMLSECCVL